MLTHEEERVKIELDTVELDDKGVTNTAQYIVADYPNVTYRVVTESGSAGGHPVIRYRGPRRELEAMVHAHYGAEAWEAITQPVDRETQRTLASR
jgi:hypothetical protein